MHDLSLVTTIASAFTAAWALGLITQRLGLSPIVGYLIAGVLIGPRTPGFVGDLHVAQQLAEIGVILLMFGVGLHFKLSELLAVKRVAIPGAIGQSLIATLVSMAVFAAFGVPVTTGIVIGLAMSVASTVVLMRVLMDADALGTVEGHIAVGWLIVEDVITVVLLVLVPVLSSPAGEQGAEAAAGDGSNLWVTLGIALLKLVALVAIVMLGGSKIIPWTLLRVARLRSRELFTLTVLVISIAIATAAYVFFGASMALGAFLAGMVVAQSPVSHQAAADALPMRDAFAVLFFVSVGMLFDPMYLLQQPLMIAAALAIILLAKPLAALSIVAALGYSSRTALTVAIGLAQIGEFSFILTDLARQHQLMSDAGHSLIVAAAIISITINPLLFRHLPAMEAWLRARPRWWQLLNHRAEQRAQTLNAAAIEAADRLAQQTTRLAVVVGYGPVGRSVHRLLKDAGLNTVVIDMNMDTISALTAQGQTAIFGNAAHESILEHAGVRRASHLVLTLPQSTDRVTVVATARNLNPDVRILVRAHYLREREDLEQAGATAAVFEEAEAAVALARLVLADTGQHRGAMEEKIKDLRMDLIRENVANIRSQRVRSVMVPWERVRWLRDSADRDAVLAQVSQERFSRWPVFNEARRRAEGYLLTKDLIANAAETDWLRLVRPLKAIAADDTIEAVLGRMQSERDSIYVIEDHGRPLGVITLEDILEQVVGQIEDEYPHEHDLSLRDAVARGGIVLDLAATTVEEAVAELLDAIAPAQLSFRERTLELVLENEQELSTDLGCGIAIPHARCEHLSAPMAVFGRSTLGVRFSPQSEQPVTLFFLLLSPSEQPQTQLTLLSQVAQLANDTAIRERLLSVANADDVLEILAGRSRRE